MLDTLALLSTQLGDTSELLLLRNIGTADSQLVLPHTSVDIDVPDLDVQWAILRADEPAVHLPDRVESDKERTGKVELEEGGRIQVGTTDWVQRDVELSHEGKHVDEQAQIGAPNTESGLEGQLIYRVTIGLPAKK